MGEFSHFDQHGNAVMVDVTKKKETTRTAIAQGKIKVNDEIFDCLLYTSDAADEL